MPIPERKPLSKEVLEQLAQDAYMALMDEPEQEEPEWC